MIFDGRNLHLTYAVFILTDFQQNLFIYNRQIQHRQPKNLPLGGFLGKCMSFVCQGSFSLTTPPLFHSNIWIENSPAKASDDMS